MNDGTESAWNFDGAQFYSLFKIKSRFVDALLEWDLEGAYWAVRTMRMEIDAKLKRKETNKLLIRLEEEKAKRKGTESKTEKEEVDEKMGELDEQRRKFLINANPKDNDRVEFYIKLENFYMYLCFIMKKHKMYYREGDDARLAITKR